MYRLFKVCVLVFVSVTHHSSFGMNRVNQLPKQPRFIVCTTSEDVRSRELQKARGIERTYRHFDRLAKAANKTKRLEYSTFPGTSSDYQSRFFSSDYMNLPNDVAFPIALMTNGVPVNKRGFVLAYHAHYRKECENLMDAFDNAARKKTELYNRQAQKLFLRPDGIEQREALDIMAYKDLLYRGLVADNMMRAFHNNHYPLVLAFHQAYCDMPK